MYMVSATVHISRITNNVRIVPIENTKAFDPLYAIPDVALSQAVSFVIRIVTIKSTKTPRPAFIWDKFSGFAFLKQTIFDCLIQKPILVTACLFINIWGTMPS